LNCNGFRVSPADHPGPLMADPRTIGNWVGALILRLPAAPRGLEIWRSGILAG
jgi:hypothetical protein